MNKEQQGRRKGPKRRFMDGVKKEMQRVGMTEEGQSEIETDDHLW